jgi:hypothetical protein
MPETFVVKTAIGADTWILGVGAGVGLGGRRATGFFV